MDRNTPITWGDLEDLAAYKISLSGPSMPHKLRLNAYQQSFDDMLQVTLSDQKGQYLYDNLPYANYIQECRTVLIRCPRQVGKSTYIADLAKRFHKPLIVAYRTYSDTPALLSGKECISSNRDFDMFLRGKTFDYDCVLFDEWNWFARDINSIINQITATTAFATSRNKDFFFFGLST